MTFNRYSFSVQKIVLKETVSRKGALVRELIQMPYSYLYDNQVEVLATHTQFEKHDEIGLSTKLQPFKLMLNQGSLGLLQTFFDIDFQRINIQFQMEMDVSWGNHYHSTPRRHWDTHWSTSFKNQNKYPQ